MFYAYGFKKKAQGHIKKNLFASMFDRRGRIEYSLTFTDRLL